jgi:hypothetical protein
MNSTSMLRRSILKGMAIVVTAYAANWSWFRPSRRAFYIAGVRYHPTRRCPAPAERVFIVPETFNGEACLAVYTLDREKLGYVPREKLDFFPLDRGSAGEVVLANFNVPPWHRYYIEVEDVEGGAPQSNHSQA